MWFFWTFALIPVAVGAVLLFFDRKIAWQEVLGSSVVAFAMAGIFQLCAVLGMTHDIETWSGVITQTTRYGAWVEQYEELHIESYACGTDSKGHTTYCTRTYYTTEYATHGGNWDVNRNFGTIADNPDVDLTFHEIVKANFGGRIDRTYTQSCTHGGHYYSGNQTAYVTHNNTGYVYPVTMTKSFENKIKAAPTLFSFVKVPTNVLVYPWPENPDWNNSGRVLGTASSMISLRKWDILNSDLGPSKKINLIVVGFPSGQSMDMAKYQEAKWVGGKKNDLVICFAGGSQTQPAEWAYVFGWTEKTLVKLNLRDIFTENPINNDIISKIDKEIVLNYEKKNWHKFDYIRVEPPVWTYWLYLSIMFVVQGGLYVWFHLNEFDNESYDRQVDYKGVEEAFLDKLTRKWNEVKAFFIKSESLPIQQPHMPPAQYRSYIPKRNIRNPENRPHNRNWE